MSVVSSDIKKRNLMKQMQLIIRTEYILRTNQEDQYTEFLKEISSESDFMEFKPAIEDDINQFGITEDEIQEAIAAMIPAL